MRRLAFVAAMSSVLAAFACEEQPVPATVCEAAAQRVESCGASISFVTNGTCTGIRKMVARCVVEHASDCDALAALYRNVDQCVASLADGGDELLPPLGDVPVTPRDGGVTHDADAEDGGFVHPGDGAVPTFDTGVSDAALDARKDAS